MLYKCLRSGNTVEITDPEDIARMQYHEGYSPIIEIEGEDHALRNEKDASPEDAQAFPHQGSEAKEVKKRGRPPKK